MENIITTGIIIIINCGLSFAISWFVSVRVSKTTARKVSEIGHIAERARILRESTPEPKPASKPIPEKTLVNVRYGTKAFDGMVICYTSSGGNWIYWIVNPFNNNREEWFNFDQVSKKMT